MPNDASNNSSSLGNLGATNPSTINSNFTNNINNNMAAQQRLAQGGVGLFNQPGMMNGMLGTANPGMAAANPGAAMNAMNMNAMNNMGGMAANTMNPANFNALSAANGLNPNAAAAPGLNNFNANDFMRLQQQLQQQQLQQQMQMQQQMQQMQGGMNNTPNAAQNMNFALMQNQGNNPSNNNNLLQSLMGRNPQFPGGNMQNPFLGQLAMMNQQGLVMGNPGVNPMGAANNFQLPSPNTLFSRDASRRMRGGVIEPFPEKLHRLLIEVEQCGRADVISFVANGRAFAIHKADAFFKEIVPLYFRQSRLSSFKRQLNLYGFELINTGPARGGYYHEMFVKERPELCRRMRRVAVKVAPTKKKKKDEEEKAADETKADPVKPEEASAPSSTEDAAKDDSEKATKEEEAPKEESPKEEEEAPKEEAPKEEESPEETATMEEPPIEEPKATGEEEAKDDGEDTTKKEDTEEIEKTVKAEEKDEKAPDETTTTTTTED